MELPQIRIERIKVNLPSVTTRRDGKTHKLKPGYQLYRTDFNFKFNQAYKHLEKDNELKSLLEKTIQSVRHTLNIFEETPGKNHLKVMLINSGKWTSLALKDPLLIGDGEDPLFNGELIKMIKEYRSKISFKQSNEDTTQIASDCVELFNYLRTLPSWNKTIALELVIDFLKKAFDNNKKISALSKKEDSFKKALNKQPKIENKK